MSLAIKKNQDRTERAKKIVAFLKKTYPNPKTELTYTTDFQFLASVILSAQCTDKNVNRVTDILWKKYITLDDFITADSDIFTKELSSITYFRNKAKFILASAKKVQEDFGGKI